MTIVKIKEITKQKVVLQSAVNLSVAGDAANVTYDNGVSGLVATNAQTAIDEIVNLSGGVATWGSIAGNLSDQTDLQNALNAKASTSSLSTVATTGNSDNLTQGTVNLLMTAAERSKLAGVDTGATANATDAQLRDRSTHTGTQAQSTVVGLTTALGDKLEASDISAFETTTELNARDTANRSRSNHTGTQVASTISDFNSAADARIGVASVADLSDVSLASITSNQILEWNGTSLVPVDKPSGGSGGGGAVDSVNGETGTVVLNADDIADGTTTNKWANQAELDKLAGIEAGADLTDTANVTASGALMESSLTDVVGIKSLDTSTLFSGDYDDLTNAPALFSGDYGDLANTPTLFSGDYTDLTNKPTIPTNNNELTNGAGYITSYTVTEADVTTHEAAVTITEGQISDLGSYLTSADVSDFETSTELNTRDTANRSRVNHTGSQGISTVTGLQSALDDKLESADVADFETSTELNSRDTANRDRANHTGTQAASTISDFNTEADARITASDKVSSDPSAVTGADAVTNMVTLTQAEFDAIGTPNASTVYFIEE